MTTRILNQRDDGGPGCLYARWLFFVCGFFALVNVVFPTCAPATTLYFSNRTASPIRVETILGRRVQMLGAVAANSTTHYRFVAHGRYYRLRIRDPKGKLLSGRAVPRAEVDRFWPWEHRIWRVQWDGTE